MPDTRDSSSPPLTVRDLVDAVEAFRKAERLRFSIEATRASARPFLFAQRPADFLCDELLRRGYVAALLGGIA